MASDAEKYANTVEMKARSFLERAFFQSITSRDKSTSSTVHKDASAFLYIFHI